MSNIYISEPATNGKVILTTTVGDIEIELWSKETPLACRNFVQLCMEGYYDDTAFHRLVKGFIVQGGDPSGTGEGGESIYGAPFKTESHSRLSFNRRGLLGMACPEPNSNGSQFFFTLGEALELDGKHTLFGRVVGNTLFNMLRLADVEVIKGDRPTRLHRILKTMVVLNPYDDIVPRRLRSKKSKEETETDVQPTAKATKNFSLLSFGSEAEEEEQVISEVEQKLRSRGKSAHDLANDARLSKETVLISEADAQAAAETAALLEAEAEERRRRRELASRLETEEERKQKQKRMDDLRAEADKVRRDIARTMRAANDREAAAEKARREAQLKADLKAEEEKRAEAWEEEQRKKAEAGIIATAKPMVDNFSDEVASYRARSKKLKDRNNREEQTMNMLSRFESRLLNTLKKSNGDNNASESVTRDDTSADPVSWLRCKLLSEEPAPARKVMDPAIDNPDRHDLYDPRNPLNMRKRGAVAEGGSSGDGSHQKRSRR
ncbi:unnamed protein product [Mesocestoides corti]|uniref:Spliceosome-associated protein CWC27 homolog n=1 Tax=Mesocestoides corti TaxID=53468 RepID=A0A158QWD8_MESCO|nr:unnamed protein product [Mesocestoides corti]